MRIESKIDSFFDQAKSLSAAFIVALPDDFFTKELKPSPHRERTTESKNSKTYWNFSRDINGHPRVCRSKSRVGAARHMFAWFVVFISQ